MKNVINEKIKSGDTLTREELDKMISSGVRLKDVFKLNDRDLTTLAVAGYELFNRGKFDDARIVFQGLHALGHEDPFVQTALGTIAARDGKLEKAIEHFDAALEKDPEDMTALTNRAEAYLQKNCFNEAADDLRKAIDLDPDEESPWSARARVLAMITRELMESLQATA